MPRPSPKAVRRSPLRLLFPVAIGLLLLAWALDAGRDWRERADVAVEGR